MPIHRPWPWERPLFGLPYHGVAVNDTLTLSNGDKKTFTFDGHQTVLVRGRNARKPVYTAVEAAWNAHRGYQWQDYALLSGVGRSIGGVALGQQSWLYCDNHYTWIIRFDVEAIAGTNRLHCKLVLVDLFGVLAVDETPPSMAEERVLAEAIFPLRYRYVEARVSSADCGVYAFLTHSEHGNTSTINLCASLDDAGDCDFQTPYFGYQYGGDGYQTHTVLTARISGNGSTTAGLVGRGISGALEILAQGGDLITETSSGAFAGSLLWRCYAATAVAGNTSWLEIYQEWDSAYSKQVVRFAGRELTIEKNAGPAVSAYAHMIAPNVFALQIGGGGVTTRRVIVSVDGNTESDYFDIPGSGTSRLVTYNPHSGKFTIADSVDDTVCWV